MTVEVMRLGASALVIVLTLATAYVTRRAIVALHERVRLLEERGA